MSIANTTPMAAVSLISLHAAIAEPLEFNRDIRPILVEHCTTCHGGVKQAGEVSFIYRQQALGKGKSGKTIIVPGKPEASEMIRRLTTKDPDDRMPPPKEHPVPLSEKKIKLLSEWVRQGAQWQEHWAFVPLKDKQPKTLSNPEWPSMPMDAFVLARLDKEQLAPSPTASPQEWLRRASFDLTGLPPTLDELSRFEEETSSQGEKAYHHAVERLLASPHYGERMASMWMDLARYADSKGYEKDGHRDMWPYRDWLIRSFNEDMPFDDFTRKQLAGDLLPDPQWQDLVATMFHRNTQTNEEGGTDDEEFRLNALLDRVNTTWTVWQASTFACAQCHDHPYDPIRQEDYYRFAAFFNNTEDADLNSEHPTIRLPGDAKAAAEATQLSRQIRSIRQSLNHAGSPHLHVDAQWTALSPTRSSSTHGGLSHEAGGIIQATGTQSVGTQFKLSFPGEDFTALRLTIYPDDADPKQSPFRGSVLSRLTATLEHPDGKSETIPFKEVFADSLTGPYDPMASLSPGAPGVGAYPKLFKTRRATFVPAVAIVAPAGSQLHLSIQHKASTTGNQAVTLRRFQWEYTNNPLWTQIVQDPERASQWKAYHTLNKQRNKFGGTTIPVMQDRPQSAMRETRLFARGSFSSKEQVLKPGVPLIFNAMPKENSNNRLGMAQWLTSPDNPLTARVIVNRLWHECFGTGIVETLGDFGSSGQAPSHPELLDHLALRLQREHDWSLKKMLREIVLSSTYRQSHQSTTTLTQKDPRNRLLARGPRTRLSAEMIRDQALLGSGLLNRNLYGPSVMPPQPKGVWQTVYSGAKWKTSTGGQQHRRALYTYWRRTSPYPSLLTFDASSREICTPRRIATNTPLQALVTMNDPAYLECAQALANKMTTSGGATPEQQLVYAVQLINSEAPSPKVVKSLLTLYRESLAIYQTQPELSKQLATTPEQAALVLCANAILNTDEALTK
ncbi:DUF1553 domain-containing protein [Verrucomicrobiaceae bacterium N1E253]|uniref:DUF1553 domain-containing protein n=1 Tax=Oceaniferula marina TaxID=2748318 RepID=A0A851GG87_9BACT|nr:PSD1 and planctomycete cytochrome C domain-containing protein [Oceaniferula marina]NWK56798.1 DUF1553 domain-containing protein [Oceaniferula marina]